MVETPALHIFNGYGVELEYMIVKNGSLDILASTDKLLEAASGSLQNEIEMGDIAWSNELALHVVEFKTNGPVSSLDGVADLFQKNIIKANDLLSQFGAQLMPASMHPWMDPHRETKLWPHGSRVIYEAYNRIFGCQGHGWSNVQSTHLNLAFNGDDEFGRLHAAIRILLPILPALAASSPLADGVASGLMDTRLEYYRANQCRVPSITGAVIPEQAYSQQAYEEKILQRNYQDIAPHDPQGILRHEWLNSRGAIARFERSAIEIRILDIQECPAADLAVITAIISVLKAMVAERWQPFNTQASYAIKPLADLFLATIRHGEETVISVPEYLELFGINDKKITAGELWKSLVEQTIAADDPNRKQLTSILQHGPLARRIMRVCGASPSRQKIHEVYSQLCTCLAQGEIFLA